MSIKEERNVNETTTSTIRSYKVEIPMEEMGNGRTYFHLPNGKRYYINSDTDEVYLADEQD